MLGYKLPIVKSPATYPGTYPLLSDRTPFGRYLLPWGSNRNSIGRPRDVQQALTEWLQLRRGARHNWFAKRAFRPWRVPPGAGGATTPTSLRTIGSQVSSEIRVEVAATALTLNNYGDATPIGPVARTNTRPQRAGACCRLLRFIYE
jgi:hypothetical protein